MRLTNGRVFDPQRGFVRQDVCVEDGLLVANAGGEVLDLQGRYVIPGLTDLHFHGCKGSDFSDGDAVGLQTMADYELSRGVTQICPAGMTLDVPRLEKICLTAAEHRKSTVSGADLVGVNLEGPFLSQAKKGAQNGAWIRDPDPELLLRLHALSDRLVKLVTVAPEAPGAIDFIHKVKNDVRVSIGHTACNYAEAMAAFEAGARQVTHLFNAMSPFTHREPGPVGAAADADCMVELICDGIHLDPAVIRTMFRLFGKDRIIIISDSLRACGMPDGQYELGGQDIFVKGPLATLADGTIAGSVTDLMGGMVRAADFGVGLYNAVTAAAVNPAKALGIYDKYGSLDVGKIANLVILNTDLSLHSVVFHGMLTA